MRNRITQILGVKYPFISGPMRQITLGEMPAAVSNSGGFGQIAASGLSADRLREEIQRARRLTDLPFGVNIPLHRANSFEALEVAAEAGIRAITTSGGNPAKIMGRARGNGMRVLHKVSTVAMGLKAQDAGIAAVIAMGFEAGGHGGLNQVTTLCLVPQLVDALNIPVVAAGGIGDARGIVAVFSLGAEGVEMGTRFAATRECPAPDYFKQAILAANDTGTMILGEDIMPLRVLKNEASEHIAGTDTVREEDTRSVVYMDSHGDHSVSIMPAGQIAGLIRRIVPIEGLFLTLLADAGEISGKLHSFFKENV
ncbi:MAG: nitronate monooxygenase [Candidatus Lindowbacteria bacterium]|nr:nitronate monooxygenase [Candidatus Lindowbacteria bacterium]